MTMIVIIPTFS